MECRRGWRSAPRSRQLDKDNESIQKENERLREYNQRLESDPDAIGQVARDQLHYVKPNEVDIQLPPEPEAADATGRAGK